MKLQKKVLLWIATGVMLVAIFAVPGVALASTPRVNSNTAIYPMAFSPALGAASSYAVLAGSIVTNTGVTTMSGDLGISPGIGPIPHYTGFPPGVVSPPGTIHDVDANAGAAQAANTAAFGVLDQPCDITYAGIKDLVGLTLPPGVYCADAFQLSGTLTLSGSGVWIFKSSSTLITSGTANVVGGDSCNVWWRVVSSATLGTNTNLKGNILALTSISMATGATLEGRALAQTGAVTMAGNAITVCQNPAPPPPPPSTGLSIFKFNDLNGNGVQDTGELPLAGKQVTITGPGGYSSSATTNAAGLITLPGLAPGTYIVTEIVTPGWTVITPNPQTVIVAVGALTAVNFAEKQQLAPAVGGTVMPVDKGRLLIPWLGMAVLLLLATGAVLFIRRRNSR